MAARYRAGLVPGECPILWLGVWSGLSTVRRMFLSEAKQQANLLHPSAKPSIHQYTRYLHMRLTLPVRSLNRSETIGFIGLGTSGRSGFPSQLPHTPARADSRYFAGAMGSHMAANLLSKTFANREGVWAPDKKP